MAIREKVELEEDFTRDEVDLDSDEEAGVSKLRFFLQSGKSVYRSQKKIVGLLIFISVWMMSALVLHIIGIIPKLVLLLLYAPVLLVLLIMYLKRRRS